MKKIKQMLSIFLLSTLVLSSAACAAEQSGTSQPAGNSTDTSQQSGDTGNMNAEGLPILKEADTFKIAVSKAALCMNTFAEKECTVETEKVTNVKIEWMEIPASGWTEKTNIMLASGDLPDAFLGTIDVANNLPSLAELDAAIEQYAPAIQELFEARPDVREASIASDGKIHSLPIGDETYNNKAADQLWINKRWMDQVGKEIPSTTDEFAEVLRAFKAEDPNGNGQADEIPLSMQGVSRIGNLFGSFGALDNNSHVVTIDGKVMFTPTLDGFYQGLQWLNGLSSEGLLDPETFTQNEEQFNSKFKGKDILGAVIAFDPSIVVGAEMINDYVAVPPLKGPNGDQMWNDTGNISSTGFSITVKCEQPEVLVRWYDYIRSDFEVALLWNLVGMIQVFFAPDGPINQFLKLFGMQEPVLFMGSPEYFRHIFVWSGVWRQAGWGSIIYIATLAGVNPELHEAAIVDGANKLQRILKIDLPSILPTAVIMLIMNVGNIMGLGFEKAYLLQNDINIGVSEIISTYVYKVGIQSAQYSYSTAIGLFNNVINFVLLVTVNRVAKRLSGSSLW